MVVVVLAVEVVVDAGPMMQLQMDVTAGSEIGNDRVEEDVPSSSIDFVAARLATEAGVQLAGNVLLTC